MTKQSSCVVSLKLLVGLAVLAIGLTSAQPSSAESSTQTFTGTLSGGAKVHHSVSSGSGPLKATVACQRSTRVTLKITDPSNAVLNTSTKKCTSAGFTVTATAYTAGTYGVQVSEKQGNSTTYSLKVMYSTYPLSNTTTTTTSTTMPTAAPGSMSVTVSANRLVNETGATVHLRGVNYSGAEYACVGTNGTNGYDVWDGPADQSLVNAFKAWKINAVRLPLNETCWLGINGVNPAYSGENYRAEVARFVQLLTDNRIYPILDLHWSAPGTLIATKNRYMPNRDHSPEFWRSVAARFKGHPAVVFDVFNEPRAVTWSCWRDGCPDVYGNGWAVAGMQELVDAVRSSGARNVVTVPGLGYANDLSQWASYKPFDLQNQLAASFHVYDFTSCSTSSCWDARVASVARSVPVVSTELGQGGCAHDFVDEFMSWADANDIAYLGWTWNPWDCGAGPALVTSFDGKPTPFGVGLRDHLIRVTS